MSIFDRTSDGDVEDELDRVETDVVVDCDSEAAWALVSEPAGGSTMARWVTMR